MSENIEKMVVSGIVIRQGDDEREILLVWENGRWGIPGVEVKDTRSNTRELRTYLLERLVGAGKIYVKDLYGVAIYPSPKSSNGGIVENNLYLVDVSNRAGETGDIKWLSGGQVGRDDYPMSRITLGIIKSLRENNCL